MITKQKRKSRLLKKFTKGAIRLSTANGSNVRKNKMSTFKGFSHSMCMSMFFYEIGIDLMQFMSNNARLRSIQNKIELYKRLYNKELNGGN